MKKWIVIFTAIVLLLSGCANSDTKVPEIPREDFDNSGEKTVLYCGKYTFPLSFTLDGKQQIQNGTYWYYELENAYEKEWQESFYTYDTKKLELSGSEEYAKLVKQKCFATNGNWPLFLSPVHAEYTASNQDMVDAALLNLTQKQLAANQAGEEKGIVTDTWNCDMDGDGAQELLFKACNCDEETASKRYCLLAYAKGEECQALYSRFSEDDAEALKKLTPMVCDLNGDEKWGLLLYKKCDYESFVSFDFEGGNFTKAYEIIF